MRPEGESPGDLDHLLLGDGETPDLRPRVELQVHALEDLCRVPVQGVLVEQKSHGPLGLAADEDVLCGRKVVHQVELLMNDADPEILRSPRRCDFDRHAFDADVAGILPIDAGEDLHQGGLSRAVLAHQGMNFAGEQFEARFLQRLHTGKRLVEIGDRDEWRHGRRSALSCLSAGAKLLLTPTRTLARGRKLLPRSHEGACGRSRRRTAAVSRNRSCTRIYSSRSPPFDDPELFARSVPGWQPGLIENTKAF